MNQIKVCIVFAITLLSILNLNTVNGLSCYACDTGSGQACADTFDINSATVKTYITTCPVSSTCCLKTIKQTSATDPTLRTLRGCVNTCTAPTLDFVGQQVPTYIGCSTDNCNSAISKFVNTSSLVLGLLLSFSAFSLRKLF